MNIQRSFSHTDLALELKDELEESLEEQQAFDGIKIQQERIGERGLVLPCWNHHFTTFKTITTFGRHLAVTTGRGIKRLK